ncbi:carbohydrate ABC transporter permease [Methylobacterium sp. J-088]|uniref:carbohydrate ABC transporter permease n=1 Tax=Methylobacterium sp. J-088 TaxID=2836664 RepID=UPI001FBA5797|nr:carbohydrate ABC transporter permease [Methylobacterium sp. J-088]MCJ2066732.1 carbohydrate ABC transporter permease [Methylobacterium sp. J-088]
MVVSARHRTLSALTTGFVLVFFVAFCVFPFLWMLDTAFKPAAEVFSTAPTLWIASPTFSNFRAVVLESPFLIYFGNSLIVAGVSTILTVSLSVFASYAMSRWSYLSVTQIVTGGLIVSQMIPGVLLLIPLYVLIRNMGLLSTYAALVIVYCTFMVPLASFMLKGFFDAVPRELEEAAAMDGCSRLGFILRILLPVTLPGLMATAVFAFIAAWNEFMFGYVLINDDARRTLTPGIMLFKGSHQTDWGSLTAASVLAAVPVALGFVYVQRFLITGLTAGAVKG